MPDDIGVETVHDSGTQYQQSIRIAKIKLGITPAQYQKQTSNKADYDSEYLIAGNFF